MNSHRSTFALNLKQLIVWYTIKCDVLLGQTNVKRKKKLSSYSINKVDSLLFNLPLVNIKCVYMHISMYTIIFVQISTFQPIQFYPSRVIGQMQFSYRKRIYSYCPLLNDNILWSQYVPAVFKAKTRELSNLAQAIILH